VVTTIYWSNPAATLHLGDARDVLATMPASSADCIVTSPPYWAKRDYGVRGQYGLEPDPVGYVETLRAVFHEARRVLSDDGTCWLNLGDSYSAGGATASGMHAYLGCGLAGRHAPGMGAKNLLGLPWRVAFARQDDGWVVRNAIVWHKPNAMPESVRDRMNCRYELVFLLVKSRHYWFDLDPIRVPHATARPAGGSTPGRGGTRQSPGMPPAGRHPGDGSHSGNRPGANHPNGARPSGNRSGSSHPGGNRQQKYGPHTREVVGARRYGTSRSSRAHPNGRNPATSGRSPPAPIGARTSPRSPSTCPHGASRQDVSRGAWCSTCSAVPAPPAWPPWPSDGTSPASNSTPPSPPSRLNGCGMLPNPGQTATRAGGNERHAASV